MFQSFPTRLIRHLWSSRSCDAWHRCGSVLPLITGDVTALQPEAWRERRKLYHISIILSRMFQGLEHAIPRAVERGQHRTTLPRSETPKDLLNYEPIFCDQARPVVAEVIARKADTQDRSV